MRRLLPVLLLAGCAAAGPPGAPPPAPVARSVILYRDTVTVVFSDRSLCVGVRPAAPGPWSGVLAGCPHAWPYEVRRTTARPRLPLAPDAADPWVVLTGPGGPQGHAPAVAPAS